MTAGTPPAEPAPEAAHRGRTATLSFTVAESDTARAVGSGDLAVLGTPRLLAWAEAATCAAVADDLEEGTTSVGSHVSLTHRVASPVGETVRVTARLVHRDGHTLQFQVTAVAEDGSALGDGEVTRVVVDRERFLGRVHRHG